MGILPLGNRSALKTKTKGYLDRDNSFVYRLFLHLLENRLAIAILF